MSSASRKLIQASGAVAGGEAPDTGDDDFANVVLLLDGDGTSGDDNNTFTDSSTNTHTITRNGNVTQGSFSPYGDNWSNYFDGSSTILDVSGHAGLNFGSGDFTLECFVSLNSNASTYQAITDPRSSDNDNVPLLWIHNTGVVYYFAGGSQRILGTTVLNTNQWYHIALVKNSGTTTLYLDGSSEGSFSDSLTYIQPTTFRIGQRFTSGTYTLNGYLSNLRIVKGTAIYTSAFTPPTDPLTTVTNTQLLTCSSNRFADESTNNSTITISGTPKVTPFSPFKNDDARDIATDGGSGYFDGSGDYLSAPSSVFSSPASTWTIEAWAYWDGGSTSGFHGVVGSWLTSGYNSSNSFVMENVNGTMYFYYIYDSSSGNGISMGAFNAHEWNHFKVIKTATHYFAYKNGVQQSFTTVGTNFKGTTNPVTIGGYITGSTAYWPGYIADVRIQSGGTSGNFTPPTSPLESFSSTYLLTNFQDAGIYDRTGLNNLDTVGNASLGFAPVYGTGSLAFDGSGDYLIAGENPNLAPGAGDFTVEFWMYGITNTFYNGLYHNYPDAINRTTAFRIVTNTADQTSLLVSTAATTIITTASGVVTPNAWNHVALVRNGSSLVLYVNGVSAGSTTNTTNFSDGYAIIGDAAYGGTNYFFNGYIDDFRLTKGIARYTSTFTPPDEIDLSNDTYAEYVTFFLDGDGTPNGQNNTFTDSSTNGFTVTKNGDVTQGVFSPYGDNWSNYFDGSSSLKFSSSGDYNFGTGDFTIEGWFYKTASTASQTIVSSGSYYTVGANGNWVLRITSANQIAFASYNGTGSEEYTEFSATTSLNTWHHFALVREGTGTNQTKFYLDGTLAGSMTVSKSLSDGSVNGIYIGSDGAGPNNDFNGYLSNVRMLTATALYTSGFTPPTSPLTTISNTEFLSAASNRFIDKAIGGTITISGTPKVTRFSPFESNKPYDITTYGGSVYFDGASNADLVIADSNNLSPEAQDFTLEAWVYVENAGGSNKAIWSKWGSGTQEILFGISSNNLVAYISTYGVATPLLTSSTNVGSGWNHVALTRNGNAFDLWLNGVNTASATQAGSIQNQTADVTIGDFSGGGWQYYGYMSDIRWVKGTAVYTSTFTPPTAPLTAVTNTSALLNFQDSAIPDLSGLNNIDTVGNAKVGASDPTKYGSNAMEFDGTGDYLQITDTTFNSTLAPTGTEDFTIEAWIYINAHKSYNYIYSQGYPIQWVVKSNGGVEAYFNDTDDSTSYFTCHQTLGSGLSTGTWYHVALTRNGSNFRLFIDGVQVGYTSTASSIAVTSLNPTIGDWSLGGYSMNGYIDDFRITKGVARYTSAFTPPSAALPKF